MSRLARWLLLALVSTLLVLVDQPAHAGVLLRNHVALPVPTVSQLLPLPASNQLAVASWDGEVTLVDPLTQQMSPISGTNGTGRLSTSIDGDHLYGATKGGGVTEVDLASRTARSWQVGGCTVDAIARQGSIFFLTADSCSSNPHASLRKLDPTTGETMPIEIPGRGWFYDPTILPIPGENRFVVVDGGISDAMTTVFDVAANGSVSAAASIRGGGPAILTDEGDALVRGGHLFSLPELEWIDSINFSDPVQVSASIDMRMGPGRPPYVELGKRASSDYINLFENPYQDGHDPEFVDAKLFGGTLFIVANDPGHDAARLYVQPHAADPAPRVTISTATTGPHYPGRPVTLTGTVTQDGVPLADAAVVLKKLRAQSPLATVMTDATGTWSYDYVPEAAPGINLEASHTRDDLESVRRIWIPVQPMPTKIELEGPASVAPRSSIEVHGRLHADESGVGNRTIIWQPYCAGYPTDPNATSKTTASDGTFSFTYAPADNESCEKYEFWVRWSGDSVHAETSASHFTRVTWRRSELNITLPGTAHVQDDLVGLATVKVDGTAASDAPVQVWIRHPDSTSTRHDGVTSADGTMQIPLTPTMTGEYEVTARLLATSDTLGATASAFLVASRVPSTLTIESIPASIDAGDSIAVRGRLQRDDGRHGGVEVQLIANDEKGDRRDLFATTDAQGYVEFTDEPGAAGSTRYVLLYEGDGGRYEAAPRQHATVVVAPLTPTVTLRTDRTTYSAGQSARLSVGVSGSLTRHIVVTAKRSGSEPVVLFEGKVPAGGLVLTRSMKHTETITAKHPADARHTAHQVSISRTVRLGLATVAMRPLERIGRSAVYRRTADPTFVTTSRPSRPGACLRMQLQKYVDGAWRTVKTSTCRAVQADGKAAWTLTGWQTPGVPFRTHAVFTDDRLNAASTGAWAYVRFR